MLVRLVSLNLLELISMKKVPGALSDKVPRDIDYFTDGPVVQYVPVVKKNFYRLLHINSTNDK